MVPLSFSFVATADSYPLPHGFEGRVVDENGDSFPDGTNISAKIRKTFYNGTVIDGRYRTNDDKQFVVYGSNTDATQHTPIYFFVEGNQTSQMVEFRLFYVNVFNASYFNISFSVDEPVISSVSSGSLSQISATITWDTDKQAISTVNYGLTQSLGSSKSVNEFVLDHEVFLSGLSADTTYYYEVVSHDYDGMVATDDNNGNYYSFTTQEGDDGGDNGEDDGGDNGGGSPGGGVPPGGGSNNSDSPEADAGGPYYGSPEKSIYFDASNSNDPNGYIINYTWDFGDGTQITTENTLISHNYPTIGNYTVKLTVIDNTGLTDKDTTYANISSEDNDKDGWSNEAERYYETDPNNSSEYPIDSDNDGVPDAWDSDDDNDGLTDAEEEAIGTNNNYAGDVIRISNTYGLFYLTDTDGDGIIDTYYNKNTGDTTDLVKFNETSFLIDFDNDGVYDYVYSSVDGNIQIYQEAEPTTEAYDYTFILFIAIILVIIIIILFVRKRK